MAVYEEKQSRNRRPAIYSERKVYCPNASRFGSNKWFAERGDIVTFSYPMANDTEGTDRLGRVLGRVDSDGNGSALEPPIKGHIAVLELAMNAHTVFIRWIDPSWVKEIRTLSDTTFLHWFFGAGPMNEKLETIFRHADYGSLEERAMSERPYLVNGELIKDPNDTWRTTFKEPNEKGGSK